MCTYIHARTHEHAPTIRHIKTKAGHEHKTFSILPQRGWCLSLKFAIHSFSLKRKFQASFYYFFIFYRLFLATIWHTNYSLLVLNLKDYSCFFKFWKRSSLGKWASPCMADWWVNPRKSAQRNQLYKSTLMLNTCVSRAISLPSAAAGKHVVKTLPFYNMCLFSSILEIGCITHLAKIPLYS